MIPYEEILKERIKRLSQALKTITARLAFQDGFMCGTPLEKDILKIAEEALDKDELEKS